MALRGKFAIVTGASRGCGKGIALQLAEAGCTLFITGRKPAQSLSSEMQNLPTLEQTAIECRNRGAECHPLYVNHAEMSEVEQLFKDVAQITHNRLDILVNCAFSAVTQCGSGDTQKYFEKDPKLWDDVNNVGLRNQYFCNVFGTRLMNESGSKGLIINVSSLGGIMYLFNVAYGVGKMALDRMVSDMGEELKDTNITIVSLWPGAVKTELITSMLKTESGSWGEAENQMFLHGETIEYCGKAVVALSNDPNRSKWNGSTVIATDLGNYYRFADIDGNIPTNLRSLRGLLMLRGYTNLARWCPQWVNVPGWAITLSQNKIHH